jgi:hypothetical protein
MGTRGRASAQLVQTSLFIVSWVGAIKHYRFVIYGFSNNIRKDCFQVKFNLLTADSFNGYD